MKTSRRTNAGFYEIDPDVQLLKKLNDIIYLLEEDEFVNDISSIKAEFYTARNAFLDACVDGINDCLSGIDKKNKVRIEVEAQISQFEESIKSNALETLRAYQHLN